MTLVNALGEPMELSRPVQGQYTFDPGQVADVEVGVSPDIQAVVLVVKFGENSIPITMSPEVAQAFASEVVACSLEILCGGQQGPKEEGLDPEELG